MRDDGNAAQGVINALLLSIPLYLMIWLVLAMF
jgi:hypothetical protein